VVQRLPDSLKGTEWDRLPTRKRVVALTFDACGNADGAPSILATLAEKRAPATFFLCGRWVESFPATAKAIAARYAVGNHTSSHPYLTQLSNAAVRAEVRKGARAIHAATGADPRPLFRFPYGERDERTIRLVNELGYGSIRWTVDTLGWKGLEGGQSATSVVERALRGLQPGEIILMHVGAANDGSTLDADALASLIDTIRARSYRLTDVYAYAGRYAQIADDVSVRFSASGNWETSSSNPERNGLAYHYAQPGAVSDPARFRVGIPQSTTYRVYAWWPADPNYNSASAFALDSIAGRSWFHFDQRANGGRWNYLGKFRLSAGDRRIVRIARRTDGRGLVIADAIRVTSPRPPGSAAASTTLRLGDRGPAVRRLQSRLATLRYLPSGSADGVFEDRTWHAVAALQGWEGLDRDGLVGPATRAALERARPPRAWGGLRRGLELDLTHQVLLMVSGGATVRAIHISSGRPGYCTPVGRFSVYRRERLSWSEHYEAWMPYALYFYRGYAIHGYPDVPAQPASHGCVRVPMLEAPTVWSFAPLATPVWIR
jgi:peptidoglycan/xylan/chitin deacetylase (PgdA/CDA1 family)